ncbi:hypothetical protein TBLA_0B02360 [Henningerozyma blattae CBS 6284]|uniref:tRNA (guanine(9)-N1)-methyltransferase n=1 Tax=Henningerozyma blattae (strain ATCC 34711 / CBS 6284 / DSM 70876 / NBRC 10599 / NRRL Y-10934 / UCD 77-7) TaxID=1071380 RepID=I2GY76_HENB6|nr:hypothetical protein TBLA_0B02360 [Tetrapisispora blattae CBS 6284]CCH59078.1 hypothetical protein TBLA_0B02360 [Tetrapisispora blattae CBS 6284]
MMTEPIGKNTEIKRITLPPIPDGISKSQWKKICKRKRWEETKAEYSKVRRDKRKAARAKRRAIIQGYLDRGEELPDEYKSTPKLNHNQSDSGIKIIMDCAFDELMNDKEITSMTTQITRSYASNRRENHYADIKITSFNKRVKARFDKELKSSRYETWDHFEFLPDDSLITGKDVDKSKMIYLTADTDDTLETLEPGMTYIVGGIVDKNRHKFLCYNKAKELGIRTKRLPIDEYVKISSVKVLTTTHVIHLMLKYFDNKDWKEAFESILPTRKLEDWDTIDKEDDNVEKEQEVLEVEESDEEKEQE